VEHDEDLDSTGMMSGPEHPHHHLDDSHNGDLHFGSGAGSPYTQTTGHHGGGGQDVEDAHDMRVAMRLNPHYPALLDAYFACISVGADMRAAEALERQRAALLAAAAAARALTPDADSMGNLLSRPGSPTGTLPSRELQDWDAGTGTYGADLDEFMTRCTAELRAYAAELRGIYDEADSMCREFEERVAGISAATAGMGILANPVDVGGGRGTGRGAVVRGVRRCSDGIAHGDFPISGTEQEENHQPKQGGTEEEKEEEDAIDHTAWVKSRKDRVKQKCAARGPPTLPAATAAESEDEGACDDISEDAGPEDGTEDTTAVKGEAAPGHKPGDTRDDDLRRSLKRKYGDSILNLKEEFLRKRKKGKLPQRATESLKEWWSARVVWPYPTEDDKKALGSTTGLNATQINNWFINQRKRHWHKLFRGQAQPSSALEAQTALAAKYGSLATALVRSKAALPFVADVASHYWYILRGIMCKCFVTYNL